MDAWRKSRSEFPPRPSCRRINELDAVVLLAITLVQHAEEELIPNLSGIEKVGRTLQAQQAHGRGAERAQRERHHRRPEKQQRGVENGARANPLRLPTGE